MLRTIRSSGGAQESLVVACARAKLAILLAAVLLVVGGNAQGNEAGENRAAPKPPAQRADQSRKQSDRKPGARPDSKSKKTGLSPPERFTRRTKDRVSLTFTYYRGTKEKQSVPIILVHGWGEVRGEFDGLALYLQNQGHAVVTVDLRGHGESTRWIGP